MRRSTVFQLRGGLWWQEMDRIPPNDSQPLSTWKSRLSRKTLGRRRLQRALPANMRAVQLRYSTVDSYDSGTSTRGWSINSFFRKWTCAALESAWPLQGTNFTQLADMMEWQTCRRLKYTIQKKARGLSLETWTVMKAELVLLLFRITVLKFLIQFLFDLLFLFNVFYHFIQLKSQFLVILANLFSSFSTEHSHFAQFFFFFSLCFLFRSYKINVYMF